MDVIRKRRTKNIGKHIPKVYSALPGPDENPIGYDCMRDRVPIGINTIKAVLKVLIAEHRAEKLNGGLRGRKVFRRTKLSQDVDSAAAAITTTPANSEIATNRQASSIINPNTA